MLVDDHKLLLRALTRSLEWDGYLVEPFADPVVALGVFAAEPHRFGMVITDMEMPGLNGAAFAMRLRTLRREIPIILYSGRVEPSLGVVFDDTVDKCAPVEALLQTVARFLPPPIRALLRTAVEARRCSAPGVAATPIPSLSGGATVDTFGSPMIPRGRSLVP